MDRVERYRGIVRRLIEEYASYKPSHGRIDTEAIIHVLMTVLYALKHNLRAEFGETSVTSPGTPLWNSASSTPFLPTPGSKFQRRQSVLDADRTFVA